MYTYKVVSFLLDRHVVELVSEVRICICEGFFVQFLVLHDGELSSLLFIVSILEVII